METLKIVWDFGSRACNRHRKGHVLWRYEYARIGGKRNPPMLLLSGSASVNHPFFEPITWIAR